MFPSASSGSSSALHNETQRKDSDKSLIHSTRHERIAEMNDETSREYVAAVGDQRYGNAAIQPRSDAEQPSLDQEWVV